MKFYWYAIIIKILFTNIVILSFSLQFFNRIPVKAGIPTLCATNFYRELKKQEITLKRFSYEIKRLTTARDAARVTCSRHHKPCPQKDDAAVLLTFTTSK